MSEPQKQEIRITAEPEDLKGRYANAISVTSQERDVVIDFLAHVRPGPQADQAALVARIFLNRFTAQDLIDLLQKTLKQWEEARYNQGTPNQNG
jgi:hypothetical protein